MYFDKSHFTLKTTGPAFALSWMMLIVDLSGLDAGQRNSLAWATSDEAPIIRVQDDERKQVTNDESSVTEQPIGSANILESQNLSLKLAFMGDPRLFPYDIDCQIKDTTVKLTGMVAIEEEKTLAALITAHLLKGKDISNHLEVSPSLSATLQSASDDRLTQLVKQRFDKSQTLRDANFGVVTIRGVVSLSGQTRFQVIIFEAAQAAREVPGVIAVNALNVRLEAAND